jgi:hypothetical protein
MAGATRAAISSGLALTRGSRRMTWRCVAMPISCAATREALSGDRGADQGEDGVAAYVAVNEFQVGADESLGEVVDRKDREVFK